MNARMVLAILLIVFGSIALAYGRIGFARDKTIIDAGPLQVQRQERESIPLPPVLGVVALASGVALVLWPRRA